MGSQVLRRSASCVPAGLGLPTGFLEPLVPVGSSLPPGGSAEPPRGSLRHTNPTRSLCPERVEGVSPRRVSIRPGSPLCYGADYQVRTRPPEPSQRPWREIRGSCVYVVINITRLSAACPAVLRWLPATAWSDRPYGLPDPITVTVSKSVPSLLPTPAGSMHEYRNVNMEPAF